MRGSQHDDRCLGDIATLCCAGLGRPTIDVSIVHFKGTNQITVESVTALAAADLPLT